MKIKLSQLRKIIREAVEAEMKHQGIAPVDEADEMEEGWGDDTDYTGGSEGRPSGGEDRDPEYWQEKNHKDKEDPYTGSY